MANDGWDVCWLVRFRKQDWDSGAYTADLRHTGAPSWSPDGRLLAFSLEQVQSIRDATGGGHPAYRSALYVVESDGSAPKPLVEVGRDVINRAGSTGQREPITVERTERILSGPSWSPTGDRVAFLKYYRLVESRTSGVKLYTIAPDGSELREVADATLPISNAAPLSSSPDWSADGSQILFSMRGFLVTSPAKTWVVNADGTGLRAIGDWSRSAWSPDDTRVAVAWPTGDVPLATAAADGSDFRVIFTRDQLESLSLARDR